MEILLDRKAYAAAIDEPEVLLEPIPQCALAHRAAALVPFQLMLPDGSGAYVTTFGPIEDALDTDGCLVRYGGAKPVALRWARGHTQHLVPGDNMIVTLVAGNARPALSESEIAQ